MSKFAKIALILPLLTGLFMTALALFMPDRLSEQLGGLASTGPVGAASLYADFIAYFSVYTIGVAAALFAGRRDWLFAPIGLFGITGIFRVIHGIINGFTQDGIMLIVAEVVLCALMIFAWRSKPA